MVVQEAFKLVGPMVMKLTLMDSNVLKLILSWFTEEELHLIMEIQDVTCVKQKTSMNKSTSSDVLPVTSTNAQHALQ